MQAAARLARLLPLDVKPFRILGCRVPGVGRQRPAVSAQAFQMGTVRCGLIISSHALQRSHGTSGASSDASRMMSYAPPSISALSKASPTSSNVPGGSGGRIAFHSMASCSVWSGDFT